VAVVIVVGLSMWIASTLTPALTVAIPWRTALAITSSVTGLAVGALAVVAFRGARTTVNPLEPTEASAMVTSGVYRLSRNPMYLGLLLVLGGWAIVLSNLLAFALLPAFVAYMNRFQIAPEERALLSRFGTEFTAYKESVRMWL
jgi:protein-S-isoprenylcysteine O-methyltransferase Ste14